MVFLKYKKHMGVAQEGMEVQEEAFILKFKPGL